MNKQIATPTPHEDPSDPSSESPVVEPSTSNNDGSPTETPVHEFVIEYDDEFAYLVSEGKLDPDMRPKGFR